MNVKDLKSTSVLSVLALFLLAPVAMVLLAGVPTAVATYSVTFDQTGITSGVTWGVTINSVDNTGTGGSITVTGISGTGVPYSYDSPVAGATGVQYICSTGCSGSVSSSTTESATYTTQYYLTVSSPNDSPSGAGWYNAGAVASFSATTPVSGGLETQYAFSSWSGSGSGSYSGSSNPGSATMNNPITETASWTTQYEVAYQATGCALTVSVLSSEWVSSGGSATGSFPSTVSGSGTQCLFVSDNRPATITAPTTITGTYQTQYCLTVSSLYEAACGWYDAGATASFSVTTPLSGGSGTQYVFSSWSGSGIGSYSGSTASESVTMNNPITETASWTALYYLTVSSSYGSPTGAGWYNAGTIASFSVTTPLSGGSGTQYVFSSWIGSGTGSYSGSTASESVTMNNPITETASWTTQYYLTVSSSYGSPTGAGWYNAGTIASFSVTTPLSGGSGTQYVFSSWSGSGIGSYSGSTASESVTMNNPITETTSWTALYWVTYQATGCVLTVTVPSSEWVSSGGSATGSFPSTVSGSGTQCLFVSDTRPSSITAPYTITGTYQTQYYLTIGSAYNTPTGAGWYDAGATASFGMTSSTVSEGPGTQYAFSEWSSSDTNGYTGSNNPGSVTMNNPITETASWTTQYQVTYAQTGCVLTVTLPLSEWVDPGGSATGSFPSTVSGSGTRCLFVSDNRPFTITAPTLITGTYQTQYYLTVGSAYGSPTGAGWYDAGATADFAVTTPASGGIGIQYVFSSWTGSYSGSNNPGSATMNNPITETASWTTQYQVTYAQTGCVLTVTLPATEWVDSGGSATGSFPSTVSGSGTQCLFVSDDRPSSITAPTTITGTYETQYQVSFAVLPPGSGTTSPSGTNQWENAGPLTISTTASSGYVFSHWTVTGSITLVSITSASTIATISGAGTITANYQVTATTTTTTTTTAVSCFPTIFAAGSASTCIATVSGGFSPTGTVTFTQSLAGGVTFPSPAACTLSFGSCSITVTAATWGSFTITATYGGDTNNLGSSGSTSLIVAQDVTTTTIFSGSAFATSVCGRVFIVNSTARDGTPVTIATTNLGDSLPSGTTGLVTIQFCEIQVSGITDGTAIVCIPNTGVVATTQMKYYHGEWQAALNINVTEGSQICGEIPVSALNIGIPGTLIVIGTPIDPATTVLLFVDRNWVLRPMWPFLLAY